MPQRKKKPITVGKRTSYMTGKRPVSAKPSQASKVRAAKKTTSSKYRSRRQKASKAKVTSAENRPMGSGRRDVFYQEKSAKVTQGRGRSGPRLPKLPSKSAKVTKGAKPGRTKPNQAALTKQVAARKAARVAARTAARSAGAVGKGLLRAGAKLAGRAVIPLAMAQEVRTMAARQRRYNAQAAARRKKK